MRTSTKVFSTIASLGVLSVSYVAGAAAHVGGFGGGSIAAGTPIGTGSTSGNITPGQPLPAASSVATADAAATPAATGAATSGTSAKPAGSTGSTGSSTSSGSGSSSSSSSSSSSAASGTTASGSTSSSSSGSASSGSTSAAGSVTQSSGAFPYRFGTITLTVTKSNGKITAIDYGNSGATGGRQAAFSYLVQYALAAQGTNFSNITGATYTVDAFKQALSAALAKF